MKLLFAYVFAALACVGCVNAKPIQLSQSFMPPSVSRWALAAGKATTPCQVELVSITDLRADTNGMGALGSRNVSLPDAAAWVRSGFESLRHDARISLVAAGASARALGVSVELVKAYTSAINTEIVSNVVVRVRYMTEGLPAGEMIFRGVDNAINWASGDGEVADSLNRALQEIVVAADKDILARCLVAASAGRAAT